MLKTQGFDDTLLHLMLDGIAGDLFHDDPQDLVVGVGVMPALAGREIGGMGQGDVHAVHGLHLHQRVGGELREESLVLGEAVDARGHIEETAHSYLVSVGNVGHELLQGVVQAQFTLIRELQHQGGGEGLGVAGDAHLIVRGDGPSARDVRLADGRGPFPPPRYMHRYDDAGYVILGHGVLDRQLHLLLLVLIECGCRLGISAARGGGDRHTH